MKLSQVRSCHNPSPIPKSKYKVQSLNSKGLGLGDTLLSFSYATHPPIKIKNFVSIKKKSIQDCEKIEYNSVVVCCTPDWSLS